MKNLETAKDNFEIGKISEQQRILNLIKELLKEDNFTRWGYNYDKFAEDLISNIKQKEFKEKKEINEVIRDLRFK